MVRSNDSVNTASSNILLKQKSILGTQSTKKESIPTYSITITVDKKRDIKAKEKEQEFEQKLETESYSESFDSGVPSSEVDNLDPLSPSTMVSAEVEPFDIDRFFI